MQLHQPAGRVVDEDEQRARRAAVFEPGVVAAIDLDELAQAGAAVARLVDRGSALAARLPQAGGRHQRPHGLLGQDQAVALAQLLAGQRRTEVGVALADDPERALCDSRSQLMVARVTALGGDQARGAIGLVLEQQPLS